MTVTVPGLHCLQDYVVPPPDPPGMIRWGRAEGCDFITQSVRNWSERYQCRAAAQQGCTFDNKMAAFCAMAVNIEVPQPYSEVQMSLYNTQPTFDDDGCPSGVDCALPAMFQVGSGGVLGIPVCTCGAGMFAPPPMVSFVLSPRVPLQYFTDAEAQSAASGSGVSTGGQSFAMDYAPVFIGYQSCQVRRAVQSVCGPPPPPFVEPAY